VFRETIAWVSIAEILSIAIVNFLE